MCIRSVNIETVNLTSKSSTMARITKFVKGVQNHWKKSLFGAAAVSYGISYANEKYKINQLMRHYCAEAQKYGDNTHPAHQPFPKIIVILNPVADRKSAVDTFEQYCAPILNLGGLSIDIVKTDSEGHARRYVEEMDTLPHAILCAGGDGTLAEIVTGLFRRSTCNEEVRPVIGVLPVGRENTFGERLFHFTNSSELQRVHGLAAATMSIVRGNVTPKDVMKIEVMNQESTEHVKPVYALSGFEWSAFTDAFYERDRYWYFGSWRNYVTFLLNAFGNSITWNCSATITYTDPCPGCSNCYITPQKQPASKPSNRRWWSGFIPSFRLGSSQSASNANDYSKVHNPNCVVQTSIECDSAGIIVGTADVDETKENKKFPHLDLKLIDGKSGFSFISDSWNRINNEQINLADEHSIRTVEIVPNTSLMPDQEKYFFIDHESYEVKPIRITLLQKLVNFYSG